MNHRLLIIYLLIVFCLGFIPQIALAQLDNEYFSADQLLRQQKYEQAYDKFYQLHQQNPATFIYLDKATECLINLKEYEQAISITKEAAQEGFYRPQAMIRLGEIHHISGDSEQAYSIWNDILKKYADNQQVNLRIARTLSSRQVFDRAIELYKQIRQDFTSSNMITSELAGTYLQAGQYEEALQEYLQLVKDSPDRMNFVQQRLIRFQDDYIYDVAILEISAFLDELSPQHPSYQNLQQLEIWLLMERNLHERALVKAKNYEAQSSNLTYILYNLGPKLRAAQKFELAEQAYLHYINNNVQSIKYRSMEELATIYRQWATYLDNYNLGLSSKRNELYQKAFTTLNDIRDQNPNYHRINNVLVGLSEIALDVLHEPKTASSYLNELRQLSNDDLESHINYIEGRIYLYRQEYTQARVSFSKANKKERTGNMAEKTRYYLALTDFYSGDYEFAKIQLNALERQNTSYYANDAVQLRLWIQNGLQADSTGKQLEPFAKAVEYFSQGKNQLGSNELQDLFQTDNYHPLVDDAILELSSHKTSENVVLIYGTLDNFLSQNGSYSPLYERLLWEKARIADQFVTNAELELPTVPESDTVSTNQATDPAAGQQPTDPEIPQTIDALVTIYEEILLHFPNGFYASYVRDRINELQDIQT